MNDLLGCEEWRWKQTMPCVALVCQEIAANALRHGIVHPFGSKLQLVCDVLCCVAQMLQLDGLVPVGVRAQVRPGSSARAFNPAAMRRLPRRRHSTISA